MSKESGGGLRPPQRVSWNETSHRVRRVWILRVPPSSITPSQAYPPRLASKARLHTQTPHTITHFLLPPLGLIGPAFSARARNDHASIDLRAHTPSQRSAQCIPLVACRRRSCVRSALTSFSRVYARLSLMLALNGQGARALACARCRAYQLANSKRLTSTPPGSAGPPDRSTPALLISTSHSPDAAADWHPSPMEAPKGAQGESSRSERGAGGLELVIGRVATLVWMGTSGACKEFRCAL